MTDLGTTEARGTAPVAEGPGDRIGPYRILQILGEGGFGDVFLAEQEQPVRRKVALKIIKLGMDTRQVVARFEQERQALALMDHPNIARVIDGGATSGGRPYFVMDLVTGEPIVEYCDKNKLAIEDRLELFAQVCLAVQHAHTKGIIHRDLKPSNILVSAQDGRPHAKVIDFGIAKATSAKLTDKTLFTESHQVVGTIQYMSPEQAEGSLDIDTRTDVYSLGVVLYQLLTGSTPFDSKTIRDAVFSDVQRMIREIEPPKPSTRLHQSSHTLDSIAAERRVDAKRLNSIVKGDLDWIVMKALEKDRSRRYDSASGLCDDVRRHLAGEAVVAAPPSTAYRFKKFVRKHRATVTAGVAVAAALVAGVVAFAWQARIAQRQRDVAVRAREDEKSARETAQKLGESEAEQRAIAETNARKADAINKFLLDMLGAADLHQLGRDAKVSQALDRASASVGTAFADRPEVEQAVRAILGSTYMSLGMLDAAEPHVDRALALAQELYGTSSEPYLHALREHAALKLDRGETRTAVDLCREALELATSARGADDPTSLAAQTTLANALAELGEYSEAEDLLRSVLEARTRVHGRDNNNTQIAINSLAVLLHRMERIDEAEPLYREAVEIGTRVLGPTHPDTLTARTNLASLLRSRGRLAEAETIFVSVLADMRKVFGESHLQTAGAEFALGGMYDDLGRFKDAAPLLEACLETRRRNEGENTIDVARAKEQLAASLKQLGEADRAIALLREALATYELLGGPSSEDALGAKMDLANALSFKRETEEAERLFRELLEACPRVLGEDHGLSIIASNSYGVFLMGQSRWADAEPYVRKALEVGRRVDGDDRERTIITLYNMAEIERELGRFAQAEPLAKETVERFERVLGPGHANLAKARGGYARTLAALGRTDEAEQEFARAVEIAKAALGERNPAFASDAIERARILIDGGQTAEAEAILSEVVDVCTAARGPSDRRAVIAQVDLARCWVLTGRFAEAETLLAGAHGALVAAQPARPADVQRAERALAQLYESWNSAEPDEARRSKAAEWKAKSPPAAPPPPAPSKTVAPSKTNAPGSK